MITQIYSFCVTECENGTSQSKMLLWEHSFHSQCSEFTWYLSPNYSVRKGMFLNALIKACRLFQNEMWHLYCFLLVSLSIRTNLYYILEVSMINLKWTYCEIQTSGWTARSNYVAGKLPYRNYRTSAVDTTKTPQVVDGNCLKELTKNLFFQKNIYLLIEHKATSMSGAYIFHKWQRKLKLM